MNPTSSITQVDGSGAAGMVEAGNARYSTANPDTGPPLKDMSMSFRSLKISSGVNEAGGAAEYRVGVGEDFAHRLAVEFRNLRAEAISPHGIAREQFEVLKHEVAERHAGRMRQQTVCRERDIEGRGENLASEGAGSGSNGVEQIGGKRTGSPLAGR